jgi:hypothetical protein
MASYTIIPDSTYSTGESTSSTFTVPAGEATVKCTVGVFTMGNDADVLTVWYEQSTDGVTWQPKGTFQFQRAVRGGGGGSGAWMQQEQFYYNVLPYARVRSSVQGSGRYWVTLDVPAF